MGSVTFDRSRFPIVIASVEGSPADADIEAYLAGLQALLTETRKGVLVLDASRGNTPSIAQRRRMGEWIRTHKKELAERGLGCAFVFPSQIFRLVLSTVFLIQRPPLPYVVTSTLDEALVWAQQQLTNERRV